MATATSHIQKSSMDSSFPVLLPEDPALFLPDFEFERQIHAMLSNPVKEDAAMAGTDASFAEMDIQSTTGDDDFTLVNDSIEASVTPHGRAAASEHEATKASAVSTSDSKFMGALLATKNDVCVDHEAIEGGMYENKMLTENRGLAYRSTNSALLDLFSELEKAISGPRLRELLEAAWKEDPSATLKIVWNARSIHLGKGERESFYRCLGWIHREHPETVVTNLKWIFHSVIEKKVKREDEDAAVMVEKSDNIPANAKEEGKSVDQDFEVLHGVSHGYWKDLLNILTLAVNDKFDVFEDPTDVLNNENRQERNLRKPVTQRRTLRGRLSRAALATCQQKSEKEKSRHEKIKEAFEKDARQKQEARNRKHELESSRHANALRKLDDPFYRAAHLTVARLFAEQLRKDTDLLKSGKKKDLNNISLAAKWAPSLESFHDKHTFIASSIAEILYPRSAIGEPNDTRELYLKRAREWYRRFALSPLRKALQIVERDITAGTFENIDYARVPSIAMDQNKDLFARKDINRFETYIENVAQGKSRISGAVLMPATLVRQACEPATRRIRKGQKGKGEAAELLAEKTAAIQDKVLEGQWNSLVQRVRDNGKIESSIAVCDVSGSMSGPTFRDGTCPMDTAIGLSLLLAEITEPPFGGAFISFSAKPKVLRVGGKDDSRSFTEKVRYIMNSEWGMNTNFVAVFEHLLLPLAVKHHLKQSDMVKQVFVFSDMQFDDAQSSHYERVERWETAFERVERKFAEAGYEVPKLVFWNLAGGRAGFTGVGDPVAPKPVEMATRGTALVSGYSQAMMKVFLQEGQFGGDEEEEGVVDEEVEDEDGDGEAVVEVRKLVRGKMNPMAVVWKTIGHRAYEMLRVVD